jgi:RHS repeat-associated protein
MFAVYGNYRYGFNGMEKDDEVKGSGNSYTTYFRQYDPRLGRWLSIDPKPDAWQSHYTSMDNNPLMYTDPNGDDVILKDWKKSDRKMLINQLEHTTGLVIRYNRFTGNLTYARNADNTPVLRTYTSYSVIAQTKFISMVDNNMERNVVHGRSKDYSQYYQDADFIDPITGIRTSHSNVSPTDYWLLREGWKGDPAHKRAVDYSMIFFHETHHQSEYSWDEPDAGGCSTINGLIIVGTCGCETPAAFVNTIRNELNLPMRLTYDKVQDSKDNNVSYLPFLKGSKWNDNMQKATLDNLGKGHGTENYVKIKKSKTEDNSSTKSKNPRFL